MKLVKEGPKFLWREARWDGEIFSVKGETSKTKGGHPFFTGRWAHG